MVWNHERRSAITKLCLGTRNMVWDHETGPRGPKRGLGSQNMVWDHVVGPLNVAWGWDPETLSLMKDKTLTWVGGRILVRAIRKKSVVFVVRKAQLFLFI